MNLIQDMIEMMENANAGYVKISFGKNKNIIVCTDEILDLFEGNYDSHLADSEEESECSRCEYKQCEHCLYNGKIA